MRITARQQEHDLDLDSQELRLLQLSVMGYSIREISEIMSKSEEVIRRYRKNMLIKNQCNFSQLIYQYVQMRNNRGAND